MKHTLPAEVFDLLPALYPRFTTLLENCGLNAAEVFALSCLKHSNKIVDGDHALLLADLRRMLVSGVGYEKGGGAPGVIAKLVNKGLLKKQGIPKTQKKETFPDSDGNCVVVILSTEGREKLEHFNEQFNVAVDTLIEQLVLHLTSRSRLKGPATARLVRIILNQFRKIAPELMQIAYSSEPFRYAASFTQTSGAAGPKQQPIN